jgi:N-acetylmuramic acid 6-phosphate (MurNAc-6-P) etherase
MEITNLSRIKARALLSKSNGKVKAAIVMHCRNADYEQAIQILNECNQSLRKAIETNK